jgi:prepilin-type N-terminal cleavage/methylation domain-containing protein
MRIIKQQKGFTLIELLLVITAIGIFSAIGLVALNPNKQLEAGRAVKRKADMDAIAKAIEQYVVNNRGKYPPALQSVVTGGTVGLCVTSPCTGGINLTTDLAPYISAIPLPQTGQYTITKTATGITPGYDSSTIWATAGTTAPTLDLNFARDKQLVNAVNGSNPITFARNSIGTYVGSDGLIKTAAVNEPRFTHDPVTKSSLGLLVEESRTNLRKYSDAISVANGYSVANASLTTVSTSTPISGITNATLVTLNVGANPGNTQEGFNYGSGLTLSNTTKYTQSVFVKLAGSNVLRLRSNVTGLVVNFILTGNGTAPTTSSELQGASITPVGNGWYRVIWTFTTTTTAPGNRADFWAIKPDIANGTSGIYVVGSQLEQGAFPTSYIPTSGSAVTRQADTTSITGSNFSNWYNIRESTLYVDMLGETPDGATGGYFGSNVNGWGMFSNTSFIANKGRGDFTPDTGGFTISNSKVNLYKGAMAQSDIVGKTSTAVNGALITDNSNRAGPYTLPGGFSVSAADVGSASQTGGSFTVKRTTYWPTRLSNTTLTNITK